MDGNWAGFHLAEISMMPLMVPSAVAALNSAVQMEGEAALCIAIFCEWPHHYRMGSATDSPKSNSNNGTVAVSRHVLPSDLRTAIKHLDDHELNQLFAAVVAERLQRGMKSPVPDKIPNKRSVEATAVSLTPGKLSAVRGAFKAGVTPSKIAKEFGLTQADVRSVIASDKR